MFHNLAIGSMAEQGSNLLQGNAMGKEQGLGNARKTMQDWTAFYMYLSETEWDAIANQESVTSLACLQIVIEHLFRRGLRCTSELTQASLTAMLAQREPPEKQQNMMHEERLRSLFLTVKAQVSTKISKLKTLLNLPQPHGIHLETLPSDPQRLPEALKQFFIGTFGDFVPPRLNMMDCLQIARHVPMRKGKEQGLCHLNQSVWSQVTGPGGNLFNLTAMADVAAMAAGGFEAQPQMPNKTMLPPRHGHASTQPNQGLLELVNRAGATGSKPAAPLALMDSTEPEAKSLPPLQAASQAAPSQVALPQDASVHVQPHGVQEGVQEGISKEALQQNALQGPSHSVPNKVGAVQGPDTPAEKAPSQSDGPIQPHVNVSLAQSVAKLKVAADAKGAQCGERTGGAAEKTMLFKKPAAAPSSMKRPMSQKADHEKKNAKKKSAAPERSKAETKKWLLKQIPKQKRTKFSGGCPKCRYVPFCTLSCWKQRGFELKTNA